MASRRPPPGEHAVQLALFRAWELGQLQAPPSRLGYPPFTMPNTFWPYPPNLPFMPVTQPWPLPWVGTNSAVTPTSHPKSNVKLCALINAATGAPEIHSHDAQISTLTPRQQVDLAPRGPQTEPVSSSRKRPHHSMDEADSQQTESDTDVSGGVVVKQETTSYFTKRVRFAPPAAEHTNAALHGDVSTEPDEETPVLREVVSPAKVRQQRIESNRKRRRDMNSALQQLRALVQEVRPSFIETDKLSVVLEATKSIHQLLARHEDQHNPRSLKEQHNPPNLEKP